MKILISGPSGFIGKSLVNSLSNQHELFLLLRTPKKDFENYNSIVYEGDIDSLISFINDNKIEGVVHLASLYLRDHKSSEVRALVESNILLGTELLEASSKSNIKWFINTGTFWQHYNNSNYAPVNLYSATKQAFEDLAKYYIDVKGLKFVTLKLSDTYGPGDLRRKIFNLWLELVNNGENLKMTKGEQLIDICYISDVCEAFSQLISLIGDTGSSIKTGSSFSVQAESRLTLKELAQKFEEVLGKKLNIEWGGRPYCSREVMVPWEDGIPVPGWKQKVGIEEGIRKFLEAMRK